MRVGQVMSAIVTLTTAVGIAFVYGWKLAIVLALAVPLIVGAGYQQQLGLRKHQRRDAKFMDEAGRVKTKKTLHARNCAAVEVYGRVRTITVRSRRARGGRRVSSTARTQLLSRYNGFLR